MGNIKVFLDKIKTAVYGKDVRGAIHDGIKQCYDDAIANGHTDMEVVNARGIYNDLNTRLEEDNNNLNKKDIYLQNQINGLASGAPLAADSIGKMVDTSHIYVNTTDGNWYYHNGTNWVVGGVYQGNKMEDNVVTHNKLNSDVRDKLEIKSIDMERLPLFDVVEYNLLDYDYIVTGKSVNTNTGELYDDSGSFVCDYIPVVPGNKYRVDIRGNGAFYDKNKKLVRAFSSTGNGNPYSEYKTNSGYIITVPSGCYYLRKSWPSSITNGCLYHANTAYNIANDTFYNRLLDFKLNSYAKQLLLRELNKDTQIPLTNTALKKYLSYNMVDKKSFKKGLVVNWGDPLTNIGMEQKNNEYISTDYIPVEAGESYICNRNYNAVIYDKDYMPVCGFYAKGSTSEILWKRVANERFKITIPDNGSYIKVTFGSSDTDMLFFKLLTNTPVTAGSGATFNEIFDIELDDNLAQLLNKNLNKYNTSKLANKTWNVLGDSITSIDYSTPTWWQMISDETGITVNNYGISGTSIAHRASRHLYDYANGKLDADKIGYNENDSSTWNTGNCMVERYVKMENNADIITVLGGTNDDGIPLGDWNSTDTATFYGALNVLISGLINKYPGKIIAMFTPPKTKTSHTTDVANPGAILDSKAATDTISIQLRAEAIKRKCNQYGLPCLDLYNNSGISGADINTIYYRDTWHPSDLGQAKLKIVIQNFIESLVD